MVPKSGGTLVDGDRRTSAEERVVQFHGIQLRPHRDIEEHDGLDRTARVEAVHECVRVGVPVIDTTGSASYCLPALNPWS